MAKKATSVTQARVEKPKRKRPGIHSKCKTSKLKGSKNYVKKKSVGQGK